MAGDKYFGIAELRGVSREFRAVTQECGETRSVLGDELDDRFATTLP